MSVPWRRLLAVMLVLAVLDLGLAAHFGTACVGTACLTVQPWALGIRRERTRRTAEGGWLVTVQVQRWGWARGEWEWGGWP